MALNFDLNSALAGAKTVMELAQAPEEQALKNELARQQLAESKQRLEASQFELGEKQKEAGRLEEIRRLQGQQADYFSQIRAKQNQLDGIIKGNYDMKTKLGAIVAKSGAGEIAAIKSGKAQDLVDDASEAIATYTQLLKDPNSVTEVGRQSMLDSLGRYYGAYQNQYDPDSFTASFDPNTHKVQITAKDKQGNGVLVDTIENPNEAMKMYRNDIAALREKNDVITAALAAKGDKNAQELVGKFYDKLDKKSELLNYRDSLMDIVPAQWKQILATVDNMPPEMALNTFNQALTDTNKVLSAKANAPLTAHITGLYSDFVAKTKNMNPAKKAAWIADNEGEFLKIVAADPKVQELAATANIPVEEAARTIYNRDRLVENYTKVSHAFSEQTKANAALASASNKGQQKQPDFMAIAKSLKTTSGSGVPANKIHYVARQLALNYGGAPKLNYGKDSYFLNTAAFNKLEGKQQWAVKNYIDGKHRLSDDNIKWLYEKGVLVKDETAGYMTGPPDLYQAIANAGSNSNTTPTAE